MILSLQKIICAGILLLFCTACGPASKVESKYPRKPADTSSRKAGPAMLLYEQAEEDLDVNNSVIVTPPADKETAPGTGKKK